MILPCQCGRVPMLHLNADGTTGKIVVTCRHLDCENTFKAIHITNEDAIQLWNNEMIRQGREAKTKKKVAKRRGRK